MTTQVSYPNLGEVYWFIKNDSISCGILDSVKITLTETEQNKELYFIQNDGSSIIITDDRIYSSSTLAATAMMMFAETNEYPDGDVIGVTYDLPVAIPSPTPIWAVPRDQNSIKSVLPTRLEIRITPEIIKYTYTVESTTEPSTVYKSPKILGTDLLDVTDQLDQEANIC